MPKLANLNNQQATLSRDVLDISDGHLFHFVAILFDDPLTGDAQRCPLPDSSRQTVADRALIYIELLIRALGRR
jgi:hypothetical protein